MSPRSHEEKNNDKVEGRPATVSVRMHLSRQHLFSAIHFTRLAKRIEHDENPEDLSGDLRTEYLAVITAAVILSVAAVEASANDLWADAFDAAQSRPVHRFNGTSPGLALKLRELWPEVERASILEKYEAALKAAGKEPYNRGVEPFQPMSHLIDLRNALVHFFPEWDTAQDKHENLKQMLKYRFEPSPFAMEEDEWFPKKCLGYGCAAWAVGTSATFIDDFLHRLEMDSWVAAHLDQLR